MTNSKLDASIPLLTEVIEPTVPEPVDIPLLDNPVQPVPSAPAAAGELEIAEPQAEITLSKRDWERLELEVREKVLQQLHDRIDFVIEQRVRDGLADVLQTAVESMAEQIRTGLHHTLDEVICRAISLELTKLQKTNI
ncbi:hypothetical protein [Paraherbaspirillum soli]|uniref:DUF2486 family protein n=1 Tax=Paraherbaspirillum soli TaxID=631222 RepID=A0ABW0MFP4_9BURK